MNCPISLLQGVTNDHVNQAETRSARCGDRSFRGRVFPNDSRFLARTGSCRVLKPELGARSRRSALPEWRVAPCGAAPSESTTANEQPYRLDYRPTCRAWLWPPKRNRCSFSFTRRTTSLAIAALLARSGLFVMPLAPISERMDLDLPRKKHAWSRRAAPPHRLMSPPPLFIMGSGAGRRAVRKMDERDTADGTIS